VTLAPPIRENKALLAALVVIGRAAAAEIGAGPTDTVRALACTAGVQRTYVYQVLDRVVAALVRVASASAGRPRRGQAEPPAPPAPSPSGLTLAVLRYRLEHPGAVTSVSDGRSVYSPAFRRFVVEQRDAWPHLSLEAFAHAVEVPLDTLRDWIEADRRGLTPPPPPLPPPPRLPEDPSPLVVEIAERFACWEGSTRAFLADAAARLGIARAIIRRVLVLLGLILPPRPRHLPRRPRYRGETERLSPGAVLVTDGKEVIVRLEASGAEERRTLQAMVDQATACLTGLAVSATENAAAAAEAYRASVAFLGGRAPRAVLHDGKPIYEERAFVEALAPAMPLAATPGRGENKAVIEPSRARPSLREGRDERATPRAESEIEGFFGRFEREFGALRLDDTSRETLITSAVREAVRAYAAGSDHAARAELGGRSRMAYLRAFVPSTEQRERDRRFLETLRARHARPRRARVHLESQRFLDEAFTRHACLAGKDARGALRQHLAHREPEAVRRALALFAAKVERGAVEADLAHRYLAALVKGCQGELDLQRCEAELLDLAASQGHRWTAALEEELRRLSELAPLPRARELAARAAADGLPVAGAFWTRHLLACVREHPALGAALRQFLVRLHEAPEERRLALLDQLAAEENGLR
jgi:hypothetical protein